MNDGRAASGSETETEATRLAPSGSASRRASADGESLVGRRIGNIHLVALLGRGGMGEVYAGIDEALQRRVAVKAIRAASRPEASARSRFLREARVLSQLDHPNICRIFDYLEKDSVDLLVLELVEGEKLSQAIPRGLDPSTKLRVASEVAEALQAAHAEGIVHRDLKPDNVMLSRRGQVKVLDFGLARAVPQQREAARPSKDAEKGSRAAADQGHSTSQTPVIEDQLQTLDDRRAEPVTRLGSVVGTPGYMSPEQARGETITTASDMYAFGLLLQTLFTERAPHPAGLRVDALLRRAASGETEPLTGIDRDVSALIARLLDPAPARRPTALEASGRLRWIRDRSRRRARWIAALSAAAVLLFGGFRYVVDVTGARDVAQSRQRQAEELIGFMLGDLRDRLTRVGRLDLMNAVADKSLEYFAAVPERELSDDELVRRSSALMHIAQVRVMEGDTDAARRALESSLPIAEELAARGPERVEWQKNLAEQQFWMGRVHWERGELDEARRRFEAQLEVARRSVERFPGAAELRTQLAFALNNVGFVQEARDELDAALPARREALALLQALAQEKPGDLDAMAAEADAENMLGVSLGRLGHLDEALTHLERERAIWQAARADDGQRLSHLQINANITAAQLLKKGERGRALELFEEALRAATGLVDRDPANASWRRELGATRVLLGEALADTDGPRAERLLSQSLADFQWLLEKDAARVGWKRDLAHARVGLGRVFLGRRRGAVAEEQSQLAIAALEPLVAADAEQHDPRTRRQLCEAYMLLGEARMLAGDADGAQRAFSQALGVVDVLARDSSDTELLTVWARGLALAGRTAEAEPLRRRLEGLGYDMSRFPSP